MPLKSTRSKRASSWAKEVNQYIMDQDSDDEDLIDGSLNRNKEDVKADIAFKIEQERKKYIRQFIDEETG